MILPRSPEARDRPIARCAGLMAAAVAAGLLLVGCGSSAGSDAATSTTEARATTTSAAPITTLVVTTTAEPVTTTTTAVPTELTPEETAVALVRALVEGTSADSYVRDPAVASDAERQLGELGQAAYDSIALDPVVSERVSGAADECAVNDVTFSCYVLIDRSSSDSEGVNTLVRVGVAVNDLDGVMSPEDVGPQVPAHVVSVEILTA